MYLADTLSKAPFQSTGSDEVVTMRKELEKIEMADFLPIRSASPEDICKESLKDKTIQTLQKIIRNGWSQAKNALPHDTTPYFDIRKALSLEDGIVFKGDRCLVASSLSAEILAKIHRSHIGVEGCLKRARESIYSPRMNADMKNFVSQCDVCRAYKTSQEKETLCPRDIPDKPWSKVPVDLFELITHHYLVTVDFFSNYGEVEHDFLGESSSKSSMLKARLFVFSRPTNTHEHFHFR